MDRIRWRTSRLPSWIDAVWCTSAGSTCDKVVLYKYGTINEWCEPILFMDRMQTFLIIDIPNITRHKSFAFQTLCGVTDLLLSSFVHSRYGICIVCNNTGHRYNADIP